jgi:predicted nucleic acid-binding protein
MKIVIDTNIIISALIKDSVTRKIIFNKEIKLFAPNKLTNEIKKYEKEISQKSGLTIEELNKACKIIYNQISFLDEEKLTPFFEIAKRNCPDENDIEFFTIALKEKTILWTNDKKLKNQNKVKVINTQELIEILKKQKPTF